MRGLLLSSLILLAGAAAWHLSRNHETAQQDHHQAEGTPEKGREELMRLRRSILDLYKARLEAAAAMFPGRKLQLQIQYPPDAWSLNSTNEIKIFKFAQSQISELVARQMLKMIENKVPDGSKVISKITQLEGEIQALTLQHDQLASRLGEPLIR